MRDTNTTPASVRLGTTRAATTSAPPAPSARTPKFVGALYWSSTALSHCTRPTTAPAPASCQRASPTAHPSAHTTVTSTTTTHITHCRRTSLSHVAAALLASSVNPTACRAAAHQRTTGTPPSPRPPSAHRLPLLPLGLPPPPGLSATLVQRICRTRRQPAADIHTRQPPSSTIRYPHMQPHIHARISAVMRLHTRAATHCCTRAVMRGCGSAAVR